MPHPRPSFNTFEQLVGETFQVRSPDGQELAPWELLECIRLENRNPPPNDTLDCYLLIFSAGQNCEQAIYSVSAASGEFEADVFAVPEAEGRVCVTFN